MPDPKPTKDFIEALVRWAGGSMTALPYSQTRQAANENNRSISDPTPMGSSGDGAWGQFWARVVREMNFHRLTFHYEIRGDGTLEFLPSDLPIRLPSTGPSKARALHNQLFVGDPQVKVEVPEGQPGSASRETLERTMTDYLQACVQADERRSDNAPIVWCKANCVQHGLAAITSVLALTDWPKEPVRKRGESKEDFEKRQQEYHVHCSRNDPIKTRSLTPLSVCYDRSQHPPKWAFTRETINPWDAVVRFPFWAEHHLSYVLPSSGAQPLIKVGFWTDKWGACYIDGWPAYGPGDSKGEYRADDGGVFKNPYGFIPIDFAPGGHGSQDPDGLPQWELRGMYADALDLLVMDASCMVQEEIQRQKASWGQKVVINAPGMPDEAASLEKQIMSAPTKAIKNTYQGVTITQLEPTPLPPALTDQRNRLDQQIDQATVHDIAFGAGSPTEPARRTALRLHQIDKQAAQAALNLEQMYESNLTKRLCMIRDVYKRPVGRNIAKPGEAAIYASLDPKEIPMVFTVTVSLLGETDEEKQNLQALAGDRLEHGTLDRHTAMTDYYKDKHPDDIMAGMLVDKAFDGPILEQFLAGMAGEWPAILAEVAAEEGIIMTNEELQAALPPPQPPIDPMTGQPIQQGMPMEQPIGPGAMQNGQQEPLVTAGGRPYRLAGG